MKIYVNAYDTDTIYELEVADKFRRLVDYKEEGEPAYERLANCLYRKIRRKIPNMMEAYTSRINAEHGFDPFL